MTPRRRGRPKVTKAFLVDTPRYLAARAAQ